MPVTCPECGTANAAGAAVCRQCGALLKQALKDTPRIQHKMLLRTDFMAAARANRSNTRKLIFVLTAIGTVLGYLVGWAFQAGGGALPQGADSVWFLSSWGLTGAAVMLVSVSSGQ